MAHTFTLVDDGTFDTVLRCDDCGAEMRYNYDPSGPGADDCPVCGADERSGCMCSLDKAAWESARERQYDAFIQECIEDAESEHECEPSEDEEPTELEEGDITTSDHKTFYQNGRVVLDGRNSTPGIYYAWIGVGKPQERMGPFTDCESALRAYMDRVQYWPNVWFISDHGNAHLMDLGQ